MTYDPITLQIEAASCGVAAFWLAYYAMKTWRAMFSAKPYAARRRDFGRIEIKEMNK